MRILGHIHSFNDEEVIDRSLTALLKQTHALDHIVLVDNGSTDGTLLRHFPENVTVIRHSENRGTSGAVITGFQYAIDHGYEWIWLFDADTAPHRDALERLVGLYESLPADLQRQLWLLSSLHVDPHGPASPYQSVFTVRGAVPVKPDPAREFFEIDATIWSGSLYKLSAVRRVGLPSADYVLDWGEYEYGYRGKRSEYRALTHRLSIIEHNIGGGPALQLTRYRVGPLSFRMRELPPIRCYYLVRNMLYFWLYEYHVRSVHTLLPCFMRIGRLTLNFAVRFFTRRRQLSACLRGLSDGVRKNMGRRY